MGSSVGVQRVPEHLQYQSLAAGSMAIPLYKKPPLVTIAKENSTDI